MTSFMGWCPERPNVPPLAPERRQRVARCVFCRAASNSAWRITSGFSTGIDPARQASGNEQPGMNGEACSDSHGLCAFPPSARRVCRRRWPAPSEMTVTHSARSGPFPDQHRRHSQLARHLPKSLLPTDGCRAGSPLKGASWLRGSGSRSRARWQPTDRDPLNDSMARAASRMP